MITVFQTKTIENDGDSDCFNACVASILELTLSKTAEFLPKAPGNWTEQWRVWLADKGYRLEMSGPESPPRGFSIATSHIEIKDKQRGTFTAHHCVAFDGEIVHNPHPLSKDIPIVKYYIALKPLNVAEKKIHESRLVSGRCSHGYRSCCAVCLSL